jgi:hypothetical protein
MSATPLSFVLLAAMVLPALGADITWEPAPRSDDFVDSIGVCTHWSYENTPYGKTYALVKKRLAESGIRHIRDGLSVRELELWRELGIRSTIVSDPRDHDLGTFMTAWKVSPGLLDMIEGANEPNNFWLLFKSSYRGEGWPQGVRLWQDDLYKAVRAEPLLARIPVASTTPILDGGIALAPLTSFDDIAFHPYAGGEMPSTNIVWGDLCVRRALALLGSGNNAKQMVATESGYHNCLSDHRVPGGGQPGISEKAGGCYFPRQFAEYWNAGIVRTFSYELIDESVNPNDPEANFGLLRNDASPKPGFSAVANLISLLSESQWDPKSLHWIRTEAPDRAFPLAIEGPSNVHHTLLSRADGGINLLLWQEVRSFDIKTGKDLSPEPEHVTIRLATPLATTLYRPLMGIQPQNSWEASKSIVVSVPDDVVILRLAASVGSEGTNMPAAAPVDLVASTTPTSATLQWRSNGPRPAAFVVSRMGRYLGTAVPMANGSATFTDTPLLPGIGFPYLVRAVDSRGLLSSPAEIIACTPDHRPDLIVESISWDPLHPQAGDAVHFTGTIANIGTAATPDMTHGLTFLVNDKVICWSDSSHEPLAPGERHTLTANTSPNGKATWTCTEGTFVIKAIVDDVGRIEESSKGNNTLSATLTVVAKTAQ